MTDDRVIWSYPLIKQVAQDCVQVAFEYILEWRLRNLPRQPVPVLGHPSSAEVVPDGRHLLCFSLCHCLFSCHWASLKRACLHLLHTLPLGTYWWDPPWTLFSRLNSLSSLSLSSCERCSSPFIIFAALYWSLSTVSMSLLYWGAQNWAILGELKFALCFIHELANSLGKCCLNLVTCSEIETTDLFRIFSVWDCLRSCHGVKKKK